MTVLIGMYSDDRSDVALIADRLMSPIDKGVALGFVADDAAIKVRALNVECAIGFCGNAIAQEIILNRLRQIDLTANAWTPELLGNELDNWLLPVIAAIPEMETAGIVIAGRYQAIPILAYYDSSTKWKAKLVRIGAIYFSPIPGADISTQNEMDSRLHGSRGNYLDRMKDAVQLCADRYDSVNDRYVMLRLSNGFTEEIGSVNN